MKKLDNFLTPGSTRCYYLENADGKYWILPRRHIATALELYQPSGRNGRILKQLLPLLHRLYPLRSALHIEELRLKIDDEVMAKAREAFGANDIEFSIFGGTPSVHRKVTIQFFYGDRILGYGKLTTSESIARLFDHEERLLASLHDCGIHRIPYCLFNGKLSSGLHLFLQSTAKTRSSYSPPIFTPLHRAFLENMAQRSSCQVRFNDTDFARSLFSLKENITIIPDKFRNIISEALQKVISSLDGTMVTYSAFHADFTPWNMFINGNALYVFDWEYGCLSYPPCLDRYHFIVQQAFHVDRLDASQTLQRLKSTDLDYSDDELRYYLLDIISRYTLRENGNMSDTLLHSLSFWSAILKMI